MRRCPLFLYNVERCYNIKNKAVDEVCNGRRKHTKYEASRIDFRILLVYLIKLYIRNKEIK